MISGLANQEQRHLPPKDGAIGRISLAVVPFEIPYMTRQLIANCVCESKPPISVKPALGVVEGQVTEMSIAAECALAGKAIATRLNTTARTANLVQSLKMTSHGP